MNFRREKFQTKISSTNPISLSYWVTILSTFTQYQIELDVDDVRHLVAECERCRLELNIRHKWNIRQEEVNPDIYSYLKLLETNLEITHNKESALSV